LGLVRREFFLGDLLEVFLLGDRFEGLFDLFAGERLFGDFAIYFLKGKNFFKKNFFSNSDGTSANKFLELVRIKRSTSWVARTRSTPL
jgi:hypothetical protein